MFAIVDVDHGPRILQIRKPVVDVHRHDGKPPEPERLQEQRRMTPLRPPPHGQPPRAVGRVPRPADRMDATDWANLVGRKSATHTHGEYVFSQVGKLLCILNIYNNRNGHAELWDPETPTWGLFSTYRWALFCSPTLLLLQLLRCCCSWCCFEKAVNWIQKIKGEEGEWRKRGGEGKRNEMENGKEWDRGSEGGTKRRRDKWASKKSEA